MKHTPFKWDRKGYNAFKRTRPVRDLIDGEARSIAERANGMAVEEKANYIAKPATNTGNGIVAIVTTGDTSDNPTFWQTAYDNQKHNTLKKAAGA
ncbi:hypothetical protein [Bifidobacterium phasiani]|uniref:Phage protein n=1 Tax=Bifidobacterium phasiani TaxID=2834431 RepID=A0ABS6W654_9BIFI|nr:hypothetical protein [Bifidobacterium phasiani]MBW3081969.1 hypothetical protein [Bifidobacterium phasiani]